MAAANASMGLSRLQSVRVHRCACCHPGIWAVRPLPPVMWVRFEAWHVLPHSRSVLCPANRQIELHCVTPPAMVGVLPVTLLVQAFGVALTGEKGWSLVFSGDTRPCPAVATAAKDATILIHEVTCCQCQQQPARLKH